MDQPQTRTSRNGGRMKTILVVEDHEDSRNMLKLLLEDDNYYVLEATTGPEALKIARLGNPDLILMDIGLPEFDGLETMRRIRQIERLEETPIVVVSAFSGPAYHQAATQAGADYFIAKPMDFDKLEALLLRLDRDRTLEQRRRDVQRTTQTLPHNARHFNRPT